MPQIKRVLATIQYKSEHLEQVRRAFAPAELLTAKPRDAAAVEEALKTVDVAVLASDLDDRFRDAPNLRWVHCDHAGLTRSARPWVFEKGLIVTSSAGRSGPALAEHAITFMLLHTYDVRALLDAQKEHVWLRNEKQENRRALWGKTIGILGLGNTGRELAVRAKALAMTVLGYRRSEGPAPAGVDRLYSSARGDSLDEMLAQCDFVVVALPLSDATYHLIGRRQLALMKPTAFIVNMGRGAIIDEEALIEAVKAGRIAGAGLDTVTVEPLPATSPLWDLPGVYITPHSTPAVTDKVERCIRIISENVKRYRAGEPMINRLEAKDVWTH
jgi:phosphoglycerate dehydrogenase-like enzyme